MSTPVDELELVRAFFGEPAADPLAMARARRELLGHVTGRARRRRWPAAVSAALVVLVAGIVWLPGGAPTEAQRALHRFAVVATDLDLAAGDHPVVYERSERWFLEAGLSLDDGAGFRFRVRSTKEIWRSANGKYAARSLVHEVRFLAPDDEVVWRSIGRPPIPKAGDRLADSSEALPLPDLDGLPSDPEALLAAIRERWQPDELRTDEQLLRAVGELLARGDAGPELRADLFRAAAEIPGVELLGPTRDPLDREGIGIALGPDQRRVTLVIDQATSTLLSVEERFVLEGDLVTEWNAYSIWATVPEIGDRPAQAEIV